MFSGLNMTNQSSTGSSGNGNDFGAFQTASTSANGSAEAKKGNYYDGLVDLTSLGSKQNSAQAKQQQQ